ncbi:MAG: 3-oxoacyl-[acyl-carrier-protein] synthase III C-terminal domain-containing protein [Smithellaceae bacterium]|nr:3-oxoacyl-[acyl-carrier-protein] synthase III C-terminal domain-containing protein [Smithellaceae bacterium]
MLYLHGLGHFHPENVITNGFLEELDIGTNDEWITERVGIKNRRTVLPLDYIKTTKNLDIRAAYEAALYNNAQTGAAAARMAMERAKVHPKDIGLLISGSCTPDTLTPAESSTIAAELGIEATCFDLNSACSTFGMQINFLAAMKPEALPPYILLVQTENLTRSINYSDRAAAVLFGDGSSAAVVSAAVSSGRVIDSCYGDSNPANWEKVSIPRLGYFQQDGNAVQRFAIHKTTESLRVLMDSASAKGDCFKFIGHQANMGMLKTVCERAGLGEESHWYNVDQYGNTGCSGGPAVLSQRWDELRPGYQIAIVLVGAGLTWTHMMLKVEETE